MTNTNEKNLKSVVELIQEADFLYNQYIANENLADYSVPILKASEVCDYLCETIIGDSVGKVRNGYVLTKSTSKEVKRYRPVIEILLEMPQVKLSKENRKYLQIVQTYRKKARRKEKITRGEMYEFFRSYVCFLIVYFTAVNIYEVFEVDEESKIVLCKYLDRELSVENYEMMIQMEASVGAGFATGFIGSPLMMIPMLATSLMLIKSIEKKKKDRMENMYTVLSGVVQLKEEAESVKKDDFEKQISENKKENVIDSACIQQFMDFVKVEMEASNSRMEEVIKGSTKEINVKLDNVTQIIQSLKEQITSYQSLVQNQIEIAVSADEIDRILHAYSEICVNKIASQIDEKYSNKTKNAEEQKLKRTLGEEAWNKLSAESKNYLVSAKVTYNYYTNIESLDYSGVCLLVTKALEVEMKKRFYKDYILFFKNRYGSDWKKHIEDFPSCFIKVVNGEKKLKTDKEFTLGAIPYVLCAKIDTKTSLQQQVENEKNLLEFAKKELFDESILDEEIMQKLNYFGTSIGEITQKYRNKAAHTNELKRVDAEACFEIVLDVEKLLKNILESFKY